MRKPAAEEETPKGFDLVVTHRDPKTGLVVRENPYILRVIGETGSSEKQRLWERPKGSGNLFDKHNNPVGRWVYEDKIVKGKKIRVGSYDEKAEHVAFTPPPTKDQLLAQGISERDVKIAELERELNAIKAENEKKTQTQAQNRK